jgi:hypothetical protein
MRNPASAADLSGVVSGMARRMPLGRPVVPDEYSIGAPSFSSGMGVEGKAAVAST